MPIFKKIGISYLILLFVFISCSSSKSIKRLPCDEDLISPENLDSCHDEAYKNYPYEPQKSLLTFEKLCLNHNHSRACSNLGYFYENPGVNQTRDYTKILKFYQKGCDLGDGIACNNLANIYIEGRGTPIDEVHGVRLLQKACDNNYGMSCYRVALITKIGKLLKNDPDTVAALMIKGCDLGDAISCHDLGYLFMDGIGVARDQERALEVISISCDKGLPRGCGSLGSLYLMGSAKGLDYKKAYDLLQKACSGDDAPSCSNLGYMIETGKGMTADPARAAKYYEKSCMAGNANGCGNLGVLYAEGRGVQKNDKLAFPDLNKGCSDQNSDACRVLALFHEEGRANLPKSKSTAEFYRKQACEYGDEPSCAALAVGFESLCDKNDNQILTCMTGEKRMLSLCSRPDKTKNSTLIYRFGKKGKIELQHLSQMQYHGESWDNGQQYSLSFLNSQTNYEILETISNKTDPPSKKIQIKIDHLGKTTTLDCRYPILGSLNNESIKNAINLDWR